MVKAVLFDSGKVLNYPTMGHWFISPRFYDIIDEDLYNDIDNGKVRHAFQNAQEYISGIPFIRNKREELIHFEEFYSIFSSNLPELNLDAAKIRMMAEDLVQNPQKYTFYPEVFSIIPELEKKYKLGIVSDAWPSLADVYESAGLKKYFSTIIISSILGTQKPDRRMYEAALETLNISPQEAIFIDDNAKNCDGAERVGIKSYLLCRNQKGTLFLKLYGKFKGYEVINSLNSLNHIGLNL